MYMFVYIYTYMNAYIHKQMHILINTYASLMRFLEKVPSRGVSSVPVSLHLSSPRQPLASVPMEAEQRCFTTGSTQSAPQWFQWCSATHAHTPVCLRRVQQV